MRSLVRPSNAVATRSDKSASQARFDITSGRVEIQRPSSFTVCIQEAPDSTWWMFPSAEDDVWLCAKRKTDTSSHVVK